MGEFKSLPPDGRDDHTIEIRSDKGNTEVFLDGIEVKGLIGIEISCRAGDRGPLVTLEFNARAVTVDGDVAIAKDMSDPFTIKAPEFDMGASKTAPPPRHHTTVTASDRSRPIPWSAPAATPIKDIAEIADLYRRGGPV